MTGVEVFPGPLYVGPLCVGPLCVGPTLDDRVFVPLELVGDTIFFVSTC